MQNPIQKTIAAITLGDPISSGLASVVPLFHGESPAPACRPLADALAGGEVEITEKSGGSVPTLLVINKSETYVLIQQGDELIGGMQNRIVNISVIVGPKSVLDLPVSCVEAGRWNPVSRRFAMGEKATPTMRRDVMSHLHAKRRMGATDHRSDQSRVWNHVGGVLRAAGARSPTASMHEAYEARRAALREAESALAYPDGASGLACLVPGSRPFAEVFDRPDTCRKAWARVIHSLAIEALETRGTPPLDPRAGARGLLEKATHATFTRQPNPGAGEDYRIEGKGLNGSAVLLDGKLVHCALFAEAALV